MKECFGLNLSLKMKHLHSLACCIITKSITQQTSFFRSIFHKIHQENTEMCIIFNVPDHNHCGKDARCYESWVQVEKNIMNI